MVLRLLCVSLWIRLVLWTVRRDGTSGAAAFSPAHINSKRSFEWQRPGTNDDSEDDDYARKGKDLASEFYKQVQQRQRNQNEKDKELIVSADSDDGPETPAPLSRKFTGAPSLFSEDTKTETSPSSASNNDAAADQEYEREFNLAGRFEQTLPLQAGLVAAALLFVVYVGVTGGITDGSDRYFGGVDEIDETMRISTGSLQDLYWNQQQSSSNDGVVDFGNSIGKPSDGSVWL